MTSEKTAQLCTSVGKPISAWTTGEKRKINNCYGILEKNAWIWRIIGIFPLSIRGTTGMKKYEINRMYATYGALICLGCIGNSIYAMMQFHNWVRNNTEVSMASITVRIRMLASLGCLIIASIWRIFRHKEISHIVHTIAGQDLVLEQMNCRLQYESNARIICIYVWTMASTTVLLIGYDLWASTLIYGRLSISWVIWIIPLLAQVLDLSIFVSLVGLLGLEFRALNEKIRCVARRANSSSPKIIVTSDVCAENLRRIAKAHYNICAVGKRINSFFNVAVIINVMTAFIILSTTLYYIFVEVQKTGKTNMIRIGSYIHWEFIHSVPIIVLVVICNWTTRQTILTGKIIHLIQVEKIDSRLYESVKTFSLQLHHQKLEFNAGGFFPINSTLIQTIVGNITTYLVILIQFQPKLD